MTNEEANASPCVTARLVDYTEGLGYTRRIYPRKPVAIVDTETLDAIRHNENQRRELARLNNEVMRLRECLRDVTGVAWDLMPEMDIRDSHDVDAYNEYAATLRRCGL